MARTTLNPFRCSGTPLPVPVLLMAKLLTLCILLSLEWKSFPDPFLPFIPALGYLAIGSLFRWSLKIIFLTAATALLFNRYVRAACLAIAFVFLTGILSSRIYFENNRTFAGCLFLLAGLTDTDRAPWLLRCQVILLYVSAGTNKLFDAGWRSGLFFATWGRQFIKESLYFRVGAWLPDLALAKIFSWSAIGTELSLPAILLYRRSRTTAVWIGILFHTGLLFLTGRTFGLFYFAALVSYLSFLEWPRSVHVLYDGDCGFCESTRRFFEAITVEPIAEWRPFQAATELFGISEEALAKRIHVIVDNKIYSGFTAIKMLLLYNPFVYFVIAAILAVPEPDAFPYRRWLAIGLWATFTPFFDPVGQYIYDAVAHNRRRLSHNTGQVCGRIRSLD
ncbi:MAG TPA: DCC1-like thiol-disulfide oxidoreductase family protein [Terriglobia bacterium]|nr:DCC1-like thiol-disulfide oxidoreductase family protein [Terriglobia bacterium]